MLPNAELKQKKKGVGKEVTVSLVDYAHWPRSAEITRNGYSEELAYSNATLPPARNGAPPNTKQSLNLTLWNTCESSGLAEANAAHATWMFFIWQLRFMHKLVICTLKAGMPSLLPLLPCVMLMSALLHMGADALSFLMLTNFSGSSFGEDRAIAISSSSSPPPKASHAHRTLTLQSSQMWINLMVAIAPIHSRPVDPRPTDSCQKRGAKMKSIASELIHSMLAWSPASGTRIDTRFHLMIVLMNRQRHLDGLLGTGIGVYRQGVLGKYLQIFCYQFDLMTWYTLVKQLRKY